MALRVKRASKRSIIIGGIVGVIILVVAGLIVQGVTRQSDDSTARPDYDTVLPNGKSISNLGGWDRVSPPSSAPVFAFTDSIDGVSVIVSQQPLPDSFKGDVAKKVSEFAKAQSMTSELEADGTKMYLGISAKGPQSTVFTKNDLLILIKSQAKIEDKSWMAYVTSLK